jgi:hypothetical protein
MQNLPAPHTGFSFGSFGGALVAPAPNMFESTAASSTVGSFGAPAPNMFDSTVATSGTVWNVAATTTSTDLDDDVCNDDVTAQALVGFNKPTEAPADWLNLRHRPYLIDIFDEALQGLHEDGNDLTSEEPTQSNPNNNADAGQAVLTASEEYGEHATPSIQDSAPAALPEPATNRISRPVRERRTPARFLS